ncbi:DUF2189 domain-containing protein [Methyloceanibacter caenitepidi]|uniref:Predicted integral membrane protein n=1 Tax=Methyloceanibacter caenitepidi TaxID=1384459 RepID=A0A0A8K1P8_9HYPH|nr:DUF2189 domain-containing protein [Methyloceanibacter caenitepidi]BAQ16845.1 predicted integral membrane protein [Methyloceanibacter caenitepidi]
MDTSGGLPDIAIVDWKAPFRWLAGGWRDLWKAPVPCLTYGLLLAIVSFGIAFALIASDAEFWALALTCGFVFVAPMIAMGLYQAGRSIERGEKPTLGEMLFVRDALRGDLAYLGLFLLLIYLLWGRIAQIVYGLSTYQLHRTVDDFVTFALTTSDGNTMLVTGTLAGGLIAFLTYCGVVVAAPMLLDRNTGVFTAIATSVRAVAENFWPMLLWAAILGVLTLASAATGFIALIVVFPWLGLASWRAYRDLVPGPLQE